MNKSTSKPSSGLIPEAESSSYYYLSSHRWGILLAAFVVWMYGWEREIGMCAEKRDTSICVSFMLWGMGLMTETIAIKPWIWTLSFVIYTDIPSVRLQVIHRFSEALRLSDSLAANSGGVFTVCSWHRHEFCKLCLVFSLGVYPDDFRLNPLSHCQCQQSCHACCGKETLFYQTVYYYTLFIYLSLPVFFCFY